MNNVPHSPSGIKNMYKYKIKDCNWKKPTNRKLWEFKSHYRDWDNTSRETSLRVGRDALPTHWVKDSLLQTGGGTPLPDPKPPFLKRKEAGRHHIPATTAPLPTTYNVDINSIKAGLNN